MSTQQVFIEGKKKGEEIVERDKATSPYAKSFLYKKPQCSPKALVCLIFPNLVYHYYTTSNNNGRKMKK